MNEVEATRIGETLANGATIIAARETDEGRWIVLALTDPDCVEPYVTWVLDGGATFWGHYSDDITDATLDFKERP